MNSTWTPIARRIGIGSALAIVVLSAAYIATGATWLGVNASAARVQGLEPSEPFLAILETLILLLTPAMVGLFAAVHAYAPADRKTCSLAAFGFGVLLAGITGVVHFVQLTSIRRTGNRIIAEVFALYDPGGHLAP